MYFLDLAAKIYTDRKFKETQVPQESIEKILMAANAAPTAHNNQPQEIIVVRTQDGLQALKKCTECHYNAPLAFLICYDKNKSWKRSYDGEDSGVVDASIVTTHMMLEATELGLGSTWIMYFIPEALRVELALPASCEPVAILLVGYADDAPSQAHFHRRNFKDCVSYR